MGKPSNAQKTQRKRLPPRTRKPSSPNSALETAPRAFFAGLRPEGFRAGPSVDQTEGLLAAVEFVLPGSVGSVVVEFPWGQHRELATALLDLEPPEPEKAGDTGLVVAAAGTEHAVAREHDKMQALKKGPTKDG